MKQTLKILSVIFLLSTTSCHAQKMVQTVTNAKRLELNKEQFIGRPLKDLLAQIGPKIKLVYGNPDNKAITTVGGTYLKFHFVDKEEFLKRDSKNEKPTGIIVNFQFNPNNSHTPLPKGGLKEWTNENTKEYGDLIIESIRVTGEN